MSAFAFPKALFFLNGFGGMTVSDNASFLIQSQPASVNPHFPSQHFKTETEF